MRNGLQIVPTTCRKYQGIDWHKVMAHAGLGLSDRDDNGFLVSAAVYLQLWTAMIEAFSVTDPTLAHVCARLAMSRSTLLRRLAAEGATFQVLLDETRRDVALRYLKKSDLSNQQISHLVGYRDPNAFQRAFRKWTGKTPMELRAEHNGQA